MKQEKPNLTHDDWTPLPDDWVRGNLTVEFQLINMQSNEMLVMTRRLMWRSAMKLDNSVEQIVTAFRYSEIARRILMHRLPLGHPLYPHGCPGP